MTVILTFDTTHHALWAEQIAIDCGAGAQVIPAPADAQAKCDLALEILPEDVTRVTDALVKAGVVFRRYSRARTGS